MLYNPRNQDATVDAYEYLRRLTLRPDSKLSPYIDEIRILYFGKAPSPAICNFLREKYGLSVTRQAVYEFCKRHFSDAESPRPASAPASHTHQSAHPLGVGSDPARDPTQTLTARAAEPQSVVAGGAGDRISPTAKPTGPGTPLGVNTLPQLAVDHDGPLTLPNRRGSNDEDDRPGEITASESSNANENRPTFNTEAGRDTGNILHADAARTPEQPVTSDVNLFGPPDQIRKPHDLNTPQAHERLAAYRASKKARDA
jgi:hypothetical protein